MAKGDEEQTLDNYSAHEEKETVLAQLTDVFGEVISSSQIVSTCVLNNWRLENCIEHLIKLSREKEKVIAEPTRPKSDVSALDKNMAEISSDQLHDQTKCLIPTAGPDSSSSFSKMNPDRAVKNLGAVPKSLKTCYSRESNKTVIHDGATESTKSYTNPTKEYKSRLEQNYLKPILDNINAGYKVMIFMRGAPGSGKSWLAKKIIDQTVRGDYRNHIFSTDDYFCNGGKNYIFQPDKLEIAHETTQMLVRNRATAGWSPLIVDNTNIKVWEMLPYVNVAVTNGYLIEIVESKSYWSRSAGKLAIKNIHGVPKDKIQRMLNNFEKTSVDELLKLNKIPYQVQIPQLRLQPERITYLPTKNTLDLTNKVSSHVISNISDLQFMPEQGGYYYPKTTLQTKEEPGSAGDQLHRVSPVNDDTNLTSWTRYEDESTEYWKTGQLKTLSSEILPKPQRILIKPPKENLLTQQETPIIKENDITNEFRNKLDKHKLGCENENKIFVMLRQIYPNKELEGLWDLFEKCQGNIDWAIEILLKDDACIDQSTDESKSKSFECNCRNAKFSDDTTKEITNSELVEPTSIPKPRRREKPNRLSSQESNETKKAIEMQFVLNDKHYSSHMKKIRDLRHPANNELNAQNSSKKQPLIKPTSQQDDDIGSDTEADEMVEITLGDKLIDQLETMFGMDLSPECMISDFKRNIFIPKTLAHELHLLWLESVYNQLEERKQQTIQEDEEFARLLAAQQEQKTCNDDTQSVSANLLTSFYNSEHNSWTNAQQEDLALQLTKLKLCETFPNVNKRELLGMFVAQENKFMDTVEVYKNSGIGENILEVENGPDAQPKVEKNEIFDTGLSDNKKPNPEETKRTALHNFEISRNLAVHHSQLKAECYQKAKEAIQKGNTSVAVYYSQIADLHKSKIDAYNHTAANCIVTVHDLTQNNPDFIDLHYLHVIEAEQCLDIFIDKHVTKLKNRGISYKYIFIITGRGLHSAGGVSTIKNRVKLRLKDRCLKWSEVNPGLLKVKIFSTSKYSNKMNL